MLVVENLKVDLISKKTSIPVVKGVSFSIAEGECFGLVGESGSGKSLTALSIIRLLSPNLSSSASVLSLAGQDLTSVSNKEFRGIRGKDISMIFQEPMTSLNPVFTVGDQLAEVFTIHQGMSKSDAWKSSEQIVDAVKIPNARECLNKYPGQLSGGMRQRIMIAMALACKPKLLIADEPTTALDVTIQAQVLSLIKELAEEFKTSVLFITHDLAVVAEMCSSLAVMYGGLVVETGLVEDVLVSPSHPYTKGLLDSLPKLGVTGRHSRLETISGTVPSVGQFPSGCQFANRCSYVKGVCHDVAPQIFGGGRREVLCNFPLSRESV